MIKKHLIFVLFILLSGAISANIFVEHIVKNDFFEVRDDIAFAITGQGLVVAHRSDVATMLNRISKDLAQQAISMMRFAMPNPFKNPLNASKTLYRHGVVIEFCSASLSAETTAADPNNILFCPFSIAVFQLNSEPNQVHVSYLRLSQLADKNNQKSINALKAVEDVLGNIIQDALY
ncbi:conserved hypothetical protein [Abyssogena phaseoliformis symbiont OG214]|uniref:DUF302 domain-containing protein n=1 Tax=Abyssogena phaseoliformis symbiont TaxID=596095 RepID=UPI00191695D8|nr:DUF302 domain-containing protein [Abyssogena phaseoliformis symbiont]MBW5289155.1 hypothetical protein [Candidatus Ruthia sp. Apha_13_S6]BBB22540.1 conserved hypothetical protein [Abyssogena phaseoliformis symbiont OG214]